MNKKDIYIPPKARMDETDLITDYKISNTIFTVNYIHNGRYRDATEDLQKG